MLVECTGIIYAAHRHVIQVQPSALTLLWHIAPPGFRRVKGKSASRLSSADDSMHGAAAAAAGAKESESWEEFIHPLFRRGRRDLLVGIKRHKDGGRLKRKQGATARSIHLLAGEFFFVRFPACSFFVGFVFFPNPFSSRGLVSSVSSILLPPLR